MKNKFGFSPVESKVLSKLSTQKRIQDFIDKIDYNIEKKGETYFSPRMVLRKKMANCFEAALFAAAALRFHGHPSLIMDLTSGRERDTDHVIAIFKINGHWGAIAKSKYPALTFREPIHRTIRELALTYFEEYFNYYGKKTLRGYSNPVNMSRFDKINWMTTEEKLTCIEDYLNGIKHHKLLTGSMVRNLRKTTPLMREAGEIWINRHNLQKKVKAECQ